VAKDLREKTRRKQGTLPNKKKKTIQISTKRQESMHWDIEDKMNSGKKATYLHTYFG